MKIAVSAVNVRFLYLQYNRYISMGLCLSYVTFHNILSTSLHLLRLPLLCRVKSLLLWRSLFGFPMTSAACVILDEEQKEKKFENRLSRKQKKTFPTSTLVYVLHSQSSSTVRILQLLSHYLSHSVSFFPFILQAWHQEGLGLSCSRTRLLLEGENISIINTLHIPL
jgi:hypothetical protein